MGLFVLDGFSAGFGNRPKSSIVFGSGVAVLDGFGYLRKWLNRHNHEVDALFERHGELL